MEIIYDNRWQATKVRWLTIACYLLAAASLLWAGARLFDSPAGDDPAPMSGECWAAALGLALVTAMAIYCRLYVTRIASDGRTAAITTLGALNRETRTHQLDEIVGGGYFGTEHPASAPWMTLRIAGARLPYIVDTQAEHAHVARINDLLRPHRNPARTRGKCK